jgi:Arc/MetJ-type ribon-helix-helix transcriptional regulator
MRKGITVEKSLEAPPSSLRPRTSSVVISSVRLPEADLKVIDSLVEAGIFKSRNEAIAFFIHRGIEASKDWLEKINATLENIRKLQEEAKKEIMSMFKEEEDKEVAS